METRGKSPFPITLPDGSTIIDEKCKCGAYRSAHEDTHFGGWGHGVAPDNGCPKFRWTAFVLE